MSLRLNIIAKCKDQRTAGYNTELETRNQHLAIIVIEFKFFNFFSTEIHTAHRHRANGLRADCLRRSDGYSQLPWLCRCHSRELLHSVDGECVSKFIDRQLAIIRSGFRCQHVAM